MYSKSAELDGKSVKCDCGSVFKVPTSIRQGSAPDISAFDTEYSDVMAVAPVRRTPPTRVKSASRLSPSIPIGKPHRYATESRNYGRLLLVIVLLVVGVIAYNHYSKPTEIINYQGQDEQVIRLRDERGAMEIMEWMAADSRHMVCGMTSDTAKSHVMDLKNLGAIKVLAFGSAISEFLAVELPTEPDARRKIFQWYEIWEKNLRQTPITDCRQQYLLLHTPNDDFAPIPR